MKNWLFGSGILLLTACSFADGNQGKTGAVQGAAVNTHHPGKDLFQSQCASCHFVNKEMTGPALQGLEERWPDTAKLYAFIRNSAAVIASDKYAADLWKRFNQTPMPPHPNLTDDDISKILDFVKTMSATANP